MEPIRSLHTHRTLETCITFYTPCKPERNNIPGPEQRFPFAHYHRGLPNNCLNLRRLHRVTNEVSFLLHKWHRISSLFLYNFRETLVHQATGLLTIPNHLTSKTTPTSLVRTVVSDLISSDNPLIVPKDLGCLHWVPDYRISPPNLHSLFGNCKRRNTCSTSS